MKHLVDVKAAAEILSISRTRIYMLLREGRLNRCKMGRRTLITMASINSLVGGA
jgi:excisionase family DNA binding protein